MLKLLVCLTLSANISKTELYQYPTLSAFVDTLICNGQEEINLFRTTKHPWATLKRLKRLHPFDNRYKQIEKFLKTSKIDSDYKGEVKR